MSTGTGVPAMMIAVEDPDMLFTREMGKSITTKNRVKQTSKIV